MKGDEGIKDELVREEDDQEHGGTGKDFFVSSSSLIQSRGTVSYH